MPESCRCGAADAAVAETASSIPAAAIAASILYMA
jgi:hypothetical protein